MSLRRLLSLIVVLAFALCSSSLLSAQSQDGVAKVELFGGYSWYHPGAQFLPIPSAGLVGGDLPNFNGGWGTQFTYNLNHWAGISVDVAGHYNSDFGKAHTFTAGPQLKLRREHFVPFGEALFGMQALAPWRYDNQRSFAFLMGGGVDVPITPQFSIRPVQVDYVYSSYNKDFPGNTRYFNGIRVQAGLVLNLPRRAQGVPVEPVR
jgi:hypothetical protein